MLKRKLPALNLHPSKTAWPPRRRVCASPSFATRAAKQQSSKSLMRRPRTSPPRTLAKTVACAMKLQSRNCKPSPERCEPMNEIAFTLRRATHPMRLPARALLASALVAAVVLPGCKKEETPAPEVSVQAEHPEQGAISEHISA